MNQKSAPNIVFCMCDELRWSEVGCYGHPAVQTPHIDSLAERGVRFETGLSNCPICMPARSSFLAGQYARTCTGRLGNTGDMGHPGSGVMGQWPSPGRSVCPDPTLAERLRDAGYHTAAIGKWHIESWPDQLGFDHYLIPAVQHAHTAQWYCENGEQLHSHEGFSTDYEAGRVHDFLSQRTDQDQPFFLYYNISPPHMPLADAPEKYLTMYSRDDVIVRDNVDLNTPIADQTNRFLTYLWDYRYYRDKLPFTRELPRPDFDLIDLTAMYMGLVTWVDDTVGRLIESLKESGLEENTLLVFTSDHGDNLGSWGLMGKGLIRDESCRVPMCVAGPGVMKGHVSQRIASLVDWAPTFLSRAGIQPPASMPGRDLWSALSRDEAAPDANHAVIESNQRGTALRTATHLLGLPFASNGRTLKPQPNEFYDLVADPFALHNLAATHRDSPVAQEMMAQLQAWDRQTPWLDGTTVPWSTTI